MCVPPFCAPARRLLGCISLRHGAVAVVSADVAYGLAMVVVHALLLGEQGIAVANGNGGEDYQRRPHTPGADNWFLQLLDLDIAWAHRLLGFEDYWCVLAGLIYGIIIICLCVFTLQAVVHGGPKSIHVARWFVAFMHVELILYGGLVLVKFPKLCDLRRDFLPLLSSACAVLRYTYFERAVIRLFLGSLALWIFGSYAHVAAKGDHYVDNHHIRIEGEEEDDVHSHQPYQYRGPHTQAAFGAAPRPGANMSMSAPYKVNAASNSHLVGQPMHNSHLVGQPMRSLGPSAVQMSASHHQSAFSTVPRAHSSVMVLPRATSSNITSVSQGSHAMETSALIRPPIAIH